MYDANTQFPKDIHFLDQAEGLPNTPVLWCVSHLIEIPQLDQITRLIGEFMQPSSKVNVNNDSDFENNRRVQKSNSKAVIGKDTRKGHIANVPPFNISGLKAPRNIRKS